MLCIYSLAAGAIFFAVHHELIIFRVSRSMTINQYQKNAENHSVRLYYWHNNRWHSETDAIIWSNDKSENLYQLITRWFQAIDTEQILPHRITLETVAPLPNPQDVLISFDRNPFDKQWPTFMKWMLIEGLLKTVRENKIQVEHVLFLEHHQPLQDAHLDFSNPWPITGFLNEISP